MHYFIIIILLLIFYIFVLHFRWERHKAHLLRRLKEEEAKLIHVEKMASVGTLAAGIAHEINNPLTFLDINLEMLLQYCRQKDKIEEMEQIVGECSDGVERIKRIVRDLLSFSHRGQGEKVKVDINQLLDSTLRIVWNEIKYKVDLVKDYQAKTTVWVDPTQISQVVINIVINAYQAITERGVITISTYEDQECFSIKISDTGCGMSRQVASKIFDPFYTTKGGTGLGLSVSSEIIKHYGGRIDIKSKVGEGSTFTVIIPKEGVVKVA